MKAIPGNVTVLDLCTAMERNEILINSDYQRSPKVWPVVARSFLVESIILDFPIPKLFFHQVMDLRTRTSRKEIVDGQQRSKAIFDFYKDRYQLSRMLETEDLRGRKFSQLSEERQEAFLTYAVAVDLFVSASAEEIRETFRRMNSYTIPLNPEELRHARYQGAFKWFVRRITRRFDAALIDVGLFTEKQVVRMADVKLFSEILHAMLKGITTTNKRSLDNLYRDFDEEFPEEEDIENKIVTSVDHILDWEAIHNDVLMKPHIAYSMILAEIHTTWGLSTLSSVFDTTDFQRNSSEEIVNNLTVLASALVDPKEYPNHRRFVAACEERTNVKDQRETRFRVFCEAMMR